MGRWLIWDWNGTLLDDVGAAVAALNRMLARRGAKPISVGHYRRRFGFPVRPFYAELGVDLEKWDWDEICEDFHRFILEEPQAVRAQARAALERAASAGFRQCVLSALRQDKLEAALRAAELRGFFEHVFGVDNLDGASKLQRGRELMAKLEPLKAPPILIGDTLHDAEVARDLGADCILVGCGHQLPERLAVSGFPVVADLDEAVTLAAREGCLRHKGAECATIRSFEVDRVQLGGENHGC